MANFSRRSLLSLPGLSLLAASAKPRVAVVMNVYTPDSHADVFVGRLLDGYRLNHEWHAPRLDTVSFYVDQFPANDMAREQAEEHGIRTCSTVAEAVRGVDAIAVIGEHGDYPRTPLGNFMYPRWRYFDEITRTMQAAGRVVPIYHDKYLAYDWKDARRIYDRVREMRIPFMCGSTVPLSWQRPPLDAPRGTPFTEVLATSYSDLEEHGYHGIEAMQSMAERRGRETGVERVRWLSGDEIWKGAREGEWSRELLDAAQSRRVNRPPANGSKQVPQAFLIRYRDGLRGTLAHLDGETRDFCFAGFVKGRAQPVSTCFYIELYLHNHWGFMVRNFENLVLTGREPNPIERTLLTNGILLAGLESRRLGGKWVDTPQLDISYS